MEENLNQDISPITPVEDIPTLSVNQPPFGSWWKVGGLVVGALLVTSGLFFAGYQYSQRQPKPTPPPVTSPTPTPVPDETAGWKTYENVQLGYSIKYPKNWYLREYDWGAIIENEKVAYSSNTSVSPETPIDPTYFNIKITMYKGKPTFSLKDWIINEWYYFKEIAGRPPLKPEQLIPITINNWQGYKLEYKSIKMTSINVFLENGDKDEIAEISAVFDYSTEEAIFNQILSTFQFLD